MIYFLDHTVLENLKKKKKKKEKKKKEKEKENGSDMLLNNYGVNNNLKCYLRVFAFSGLNIINYYNN